MNANPEQAFDSGAATRLSTAETQPKRVSWFSSYDEEWATFLSANKMKKKTRPGINSSEAEALPRVWNAPHA